MTIGEASGPDVDVWPDNLQAVNVFVAMGSQWRAGMAGPTGLDYASLPVVMRMQGIKRADWPQVFDEVRVLENEALATIAKRQA